jgi:hypothetical protein
VDVVEIRCGGVAQDRYRWRALVNAIKNLGAGSIKCWELPSGCKTGGLSSNAQLHGVSELEG